MSLTILDGGMGQELLARSKRAPTGLWSVQFLLDDPDLVREVHRMYFEAGAQIATTNTYSVLPDRLDHHGIGDRLDALGILACTLACEARDAHGSGQVAGSLGPIGFSYQPDKAPPAEQAAEAYAPLALRHADYVDFHLLETMSSVEQARGGVMGASVTGKPIWLAVSVDDTDGSKLRSGEPVADILPLVAEFGVAAILVNCSAPEAVSQAVELLQGTTPVGAYANGFVAIANNFSEIGATVDLLEVREDLDPPAYLDFAKRWAASGASIIGGCCEVGPDHIRALAQHFKG
ncbi:homocysteine S-methyltransferase [Litoreibacter ponti]|uniref:Homocysteine S-methyltransferase n=1 Tax=Litoreibacter ponti TaxID=1510457 RepID=A0A2T6BNQ6_9RHOB|nr:homocysteine S-methyltransferase family protein [Litoreibacter ponti]PTX57682.1 homocysteine S-methyltransferase [Litoreibacter ponti]